MDPEIEDMEPPPLHDAAMLAPLAVVRRRIRESRDVDALWWGRTALWEAVMQRRDDVARLLLQAGADPWRVMIGGWSPGRLNLAGPVTDLFGAPPAGIALSAEEQAAVAESHRLIAAIGRLDPEGHSFACVAGIDPAEAARRLSAEPLRGVDTDTLVEGAWASKLDDEDLETIVGVTEVPGGCVLGQWWNFTPSTPGVLAKLTPGTIGYGIFGNTKSGNQGRAFRDGVLVDWDLHPGDGTSGLDDTAEEVLRTYLYHHHPLPSCCDYAGIHPQDPRSFTGPPDTWLRLPTMELWPEN